MSKQLLKRTAYRYYWILPLAIVILGSCWLSLGAWNYLHEPILLDIIWNPQLKMMEPIYANANSSFLMELFRTLMLIPTIGLMWWSFPIWFQVVYTPCFAWFCLQAIVRITPIRLSD